MICLSFLSSCHSLWQKDFVLGVRTSNFGRLVTSQGLDNAMPVASENRSKNTEKPQSSSLRMSGMGSWSRQSSIILFWWAEDEEPTDLLFRTLIKCALLQSRIETTSMLRSYIPIMGCQEADPLPVGLLLPGFRLLSEQESDSQDEVGEVALVHGQQPIYRS